MCQQAVKFKVTGLLSCYCEPTVINDDVKIIMFEGKLIGKEINKDQIRNSHSRKDAVVKMHHIKNIIKQFVTGGKNQQLIVSGESQRV